MRIIITTSQDHESGGFSYLRAETDGGYCEGVLPCSIGNIMWSLIRFGYLEDPRVQRGINWIIRYQRFDDGIKEALKGRPYDRQGHPHCWGYTCTRYVHTCHMGVIKALKALSEIPVNKRSKEVVKTIEEGLSTCLNIIFTREVVI